MTTIPSPFFARLENPFIPPNMETGITAAAIGDFPPLHSLPPSFWEPVVPIPEPVPTPPVKTPAAPTFQELALRSDGNAENFSDNRLKAIIIKAQPHHTTDTLAHLTRDQLVKHVDDLVV
jgi:hypothetical protein